MSGLLKCTLLVACGLLGIFILDRFFLNPRALTTSGTVLLVGLFAIAALSGASLLTLRTRIGPLVANAWLAAASSMVAYLALDLMGGLFIIRSSDVSIIRDDYVHHRLAPNTTSEIRTSEFAYIQHVNDLGFRGRHVDARKAADTFRILMLGDSFTMGKGVADADTFSMLLEARLNEPVYGPDRPRVEVLNAGVDSYAPVLAWLALERIGPQVSPDLVILNVDMSDLVQEQTYRRLAVRNPDGKIIAVPAPPPRRVGGVAWRGG